jgi:hypothetical protein
MEQNSASHMAACKAAGHISNWWHDSHLATTQTPSSNDQLYPRCLKQQLLLFSCKIASIRPSRSRESSSAVNDFYLSRKRDVNAAKTFLRQAMKNQRAPAKITLDAYAASHRAVADFKQSGELPKR